MSKPYPKRPVTVGLERAYEVIRRPLITEKATRVSAHNQQADFHQFFRS